MHLTACPSEHHRRIWARTGHLSVGTGPIRTWPVAHRVSLSPPELSVRSRVVIDLVTIFVCFHADNLPGRLSFETCQACDALLKPKISLGVLTPARARRLPRARAARRGPVGRREPIRRRTGTPAWGISGDGVPGRRRPGPSSRARVQALPILRQRLARATSDRPKS